MIGALFRFGTEIVEVRIEKTEIYFRTSTFGGGFATIDGLKLDKKGVIKEHPDLDGRDDWRPEAIKRLKEKMRLLANEYTRMEYIISELKKVGYTPLVLQKKGFRPTKIK